MTSYHRLALISACSSLLVLSLLLFNLPQLYLNINAQRDELEMKSATFKEQSDVLWKELVSLLELNPRERREVQFFSRNKRAFVDGNAFCRGCMQLACPVGPPGIPGAPGADGTPGDGGNQGISGEDGFDVQLESEPELPCVVCPGGPPGLRGPQGERGRAGGSGRKGLPGSDGFYGKDGPRGSPGLPGNKGMNGPPGLDGPLGDTAIAGVGIRGPKGPPGPAGPKGRPGPRGRNNYGAGEPGVVGEQGRTGPNGGPGEFGNDGPYGPPGDPGMPSTYCPSDCGVQQIVAGDMLPLTSGTLGDKMSRYDDVTNSQQRNNGYRRNDFVVRPLHVAASPDTEKPHIVFLNDSE